MARELELYAARVRNYEMVYAHYRLKEKAPPRSVSGYHAQDPSRIVLQLLRPPCHPQEPFPTFFSVL